MKSQFLALSLVFTAQTMAVARGSAAVAGEMVINFSTSLNEFPTASAAFSGCAAPAEILTCLQLPK